MKKQAFKKNEERLRNLWDNFKWTSIWIIGVPEGKEEEQEIENLFEKITKENFPNLVKEINLQVQEAQRVPKKLDSKRNTPKHIIIKLPMIKDKEKILKAAREKETVTTKGFPQDHQLISQKKPCRQEGAGKKYSKSWKARTYTQDDFTQQSFHLEWKVR